MNHIKAFCFDVFGTVVDWRNGIARETAEFLGRHALNQIDPHAFADAWRSLYQPAMQACRKGERPYTRLDILHRENLMKTLASFGVDASQFPEHELAELNLAWHRLDLWPDVPVGLRRLKTRYIVAPASNGNIAIMVDLARRGGLSWDAILGAEVTRAYKPAPEAYTRMAEILGVSPGEICMVAAHNNDLHAARQCGLSTAFVPRPTEHGPGQTSDLESAESWDIVAADFCDLSQKAGC